MLGDKNSPAVGKFTHPSGAPDNHLLTVYSPGPVNHQYTHLPQLDGGIYLIKNGAVVEEPAQMRLIKNDPNYNECWPRAVVPYQRIYGIEGAEAARAAGERRHALASICRRARRSAWSAPRASTNARAIRTARCPTGKVTATYAGGNDPWRGLDAFTSHGNGMPLNLHNQGGDVGLYENERHPRGPHPGHGADHRPPSRREHRPPFLQPCQRAAADPRRDSVRKFGAAAATATAGQPRDPDGNPDTSFLAKIPADTAFTFQTLDKRGMVLNTSQTWHQLRPGEIRNNCGGCHAHSQKPTDFALTAAARPDYNVWDLVNTTPLLTDEGRATNRSRSGTPRTKPGLRIAQGRPAERRILARHQADPRAQLRRLPHEERASKPAGNLVLDADDELIQHEQHGKFPGTYYRLALDERREVRPQADRLRFLGLSECLALHPQDAVAPHAARLEDLRRAARWLLQRRPSVRARAGRRLLHAQRRACADGQSTAPATISISSASKCRRPTPSPANTRRPTAASSKSRRSPTKTASPSCAGSTSAARSISIATQRRRRPRPRLVPR